MHGRVLKITVVSAYFIVFFVTGVLTLYVGNLPANEVSLIVEPFHNVVFSWHLACWMVLGMIANYLWDLFGEKKGFADISLPALLIPILVSPIVFFAIWSLVQKDSSGMAKIDLIWPLIAFQNGFFWQVIFSKAAPK
ncbi:hypothetical protein [Pseudomonas sp. ACN5]|uniref:hypothetical protein n=1 Tax=Pseudomonas sp. ACN5 TaxID=1920427 RepID=UPI0011424C62|nr:hypothetical protein [Pseudomonas sp. ACN5]